MGAKARALVIGAILVVAVLFVSSFPARDVAGRTKPRFQSAFIPTPLMPFSANWTTAFDQFNGYLYASYTNASGNVGGVAVVEAGKSLANITIVGGPGPLLYDPSNHFVYVASWYGNYVAIINGTTVIGRLLVPYSPVEFAYDASDNLVCLLTEPTTGSGGDVAVIKGTVLAATIEATCPGNGCGGLLYDPANGDVYLAQNNTVGIIRGTTLVSTLQVGKRRFNALRSF